MPRFLPRALRLPLHAVAGRDTLARHVARTLQPRGADLARFLHCYAFKNDERAFALRLLQRRTQLWLFRAHQGAACGDFLLVDVSRVAPAAREVVVVDLKSGRDVREGGTAGWQMRHAAAAVAELAARGVVGPDAPFTVLTGDGAALLDRFGAA